MKHQLARINLVAGKIDQRRVQFGLLVVTLILFVLGAGAPGIGGGTNGGG